MGNIVILDTGYVSPDEVGTQLTTSYRANSGNEINLKGIKVGIASGGNYDDSPTLNNFELATPNFCSIENNKITLSGVLDLNISEDKGLMYELSRLPHTIGYKFLYYSDLENEGPKNIITLLSNNHTFSSAQQTTYSISNAYYYINVYFTKFNIFQEPKTNIIGWELEGIQGPFA